MYNVKPYLDRCMKSVLNQTFVDWEAILVDDGSTDGSSELCDQYSKLDSRIKVIHKSNEGLGLTRNCGVRNCIGEYVFFLDSDDYIEQDALEILYEDIKKNNADLVAGNFYYQNELVKLPIKGGAYIGDEVKKQIISRIIGSTPGKDDLLSPSACGKLYRKSLFIDNDLWFPSERKLIWEDLAFNYNCFLKCNCICLESHPVYRYCYNGKSLTHQYDKDKLKKVMSMYRYMEMRIAETLDEPELYDRLNNNFLGHIRTCLKLEAYYSKDNGLRYALERINEMCSDKEVKGIIRRFPKKYYSKSQAALSWGIEHEVSLLVYLLCWAQNTRKKIV